MSLIKCPECGKEISDKSTVCINCGYPLNSETTNNNSILFDGFSSSFETNKNINQSKNKTDIKCPKCGAPSSLTPKGRVRLCKKCAEEKKLNTKNQNEKKFNESNALDENISNSSNEVKQKNIEKFTGIDYTKNNTIKRFIFQFLLSIIGAGISFVIGGLIVYIIQEILAGLALNLLVITMIVMAISSICFGIGIGLVGPITLSQGGYVKEENKGFIVKAKSKPLKVLSLTVFSILTIVGIILLVLAFILYKDKIDPYTDNENTLMVVIIPFIIAVFYFTLTISTLININQSTCPHCGHIDCKIPVGKSDVKTEEKTEEKEVTYSGSSYDVVDSSGNTIGSIRGSSTSATKHRTVTTKSWTVYTKCKICGKRSNVKESSTEKTKWQ